MEIVVLVADWGAAWNVKTPYLSPFSRAHMPSTVFITQVRQFCENHYKRALTQAASYALDHDGPCSTEQAGRSCLFSLWSKAHRSTSILSQAIIQRWDSGSVCQTIMGSGQGGVPGSMGEDHYWGQWHHRRETHGCCHLCSAVFWVVVWESGCRGMFISKTDVACWVKLCCPDVSF